MKGAEQIVPAVRSVAEGEALDQIVRDLALGQVSAGRLGASELSAVERRGALQCGLDPLELAVDSGAALPPARQRDAIAPRQRLDRPGEVVARKQHMELDRVATASTAEAVEQPLIRIDAEGRRLLLVERTEPLEPSARLLELRVLAGDRLDLDRVAHRLDELGRQMDVAVRHLLRA